MEPFTTKQLYYSDNSARPDFYVIKSLENTFIFRLHPLYCCEAQARVRQGQARDGP